MLLFRIDLLISVYFRDSELIAFLYLAFHPYERYENMVGQIVGQAGRFPVCWAVGTYFSFIASVEGGGG